MRRAIVRCQVRQVDPARVVLCPGDVGSKTTCQRRRRSGTSVLTRDTLQYSHCLCWPCHDPRELGAMRSPISAKEVRGRVEGSLELRSRGAGEKRRTGEAGKREAEPRAASRVGTNSQVENQRRRRERQRCSRGRVGSNRSRGCRTVGFPACRVLDKRTSPDRVPRRTSP